jgi:hypothetical protein
MFPRLGFLVILALAFLNACSSASTSNAHPGKWRGGSIAATGTVTIRSVSCPQKSFCAGVDLKRPVVTIWDGSKWSEPQQIDDLGSKLNAISCAASDRCMAVDNHGKAITWNGINWSKPLLIDKGTAPVGRPVALHFAGGATSTMALASTHIGARSFQPLSTEGAPPSLVAVTCPESNFCAAVDNEGNALTWDGTQWSDPLAIEFNAVALTGISCPFNQSCYAIDGQGQVVVWDGFTWKVPTRIDGNHVLTAISCPSPYFCAAVDGSGDAVTWNSASWTTPQNIDGTRGMTAISCPSATYCVAGDSSGNELTWDGQTWSGPTHISDASITSASCSQSVCELTDANGNAFEAQS